MSGKTPESNKKSEKVKNLLQTPRLKKKKTSNRYVGIT
jgi:phage pi2 protein 07